MPYLQCQCSEYSFCPTHRCRHEGCRNYVGTHTVRAGEITTTYYHYYCPTHNQCAAEFSPCHEMLVMSKYNVLRIHSHGPAWKEADEVDKGCLPDWWHMNPEFQPKKFAKVDLLKFACSMSGQTGWTMSCFDDLDPVVDGTGDMVWTIEKGIKKNEDKRTYKEAIEFYPFSQNMPTNWSEMFLTILDALNPVTKALFSFERRMWRGLASTVWDN